MRTGAAQIGAERVGGDAARDARLVVVGPLHGVILHGALGDVLERELGRDRDLINGDLGADGRIVERDLIVLAVAGLAQLIGVDHECELVAFLDGVEVRLQIDGVVVVLADLEGDLRAGGGGVVARVRVAQIHPAARDDLVADVGGVELGVVVVAQAAAHPRAAGGDGLGHVAALRVVGRERRALGRDVDEHGADHERVAVDQLGAVRQGHGHGAVCARCADVVVVVKSVCLFADIVVVVDGAARAVRLRRVIVIGAGGEAHGHAALDDGVGVYIHGVHGAHVGGAGGELVTPVSAVDALRVVIAVDGGRAGVVGVGHDDALVGRPAVIGVPDGGVDVALRGDGSHVLGAVFHTAQVVAEPAVEDVVVALAVNVELEVAGGIARGQVRILVQQELDVHAGLLIGLIHEVKFLRAHVVVVEAVHDQRRALDVFRVERVVAGRPVLGVVAVALELILLDLVHVVAVLFGDGGVVVRIEVAAVAVPAEPLGVVDAAVGGNALRVGVLIPACDAGDGDDGLKAGDAGRCQTELRRAGVGTAGHADLAARPVGRDGDVAGLVGVGHAVAVQPFDHALERIDLQIGAAGLKAVGALRAQTAALDHGKAAHEIVVIPVEVLVVIHLLVRIPVVPVGAVGGGRRVRGRGGAGGHALARLAVELGDVIALAAEVLAGVHAGVAAGDVRARLVDGGRLVVALHRCARDLHERLDEVELAVVVGVVVGLDIDAVADDVALVVAVALRDLAGRVREDGLRHAVHVQRLQLVRVQRVIHLVGDRLHLAVSRERAGGIGVGVRIDHAHAARLRQIVIRERAELLLGHARPQQQCAHCVRYGQFGVFACAVGDERSAVDVCQIGIRHGGRAAVVDGERRAGQKRQHHDQRQQQSQDSPLHDKPSFSV